MKHLSMLTLGAAIVIAGASAVYAHSGATGVVAERMHHMKMMADAMKTMGPMMKGAQPLNAETVEKQAAMIRSHAGETLKKVFPEGSLDSPSEAIPAIWEDWDTFAALADRLELFAHGLELAAGDESQSGADAMMDVSEMGQMSAEEIGAMPADAVFGMIGKTCSDCHTQFRQKKS
ncbi:c-type cytochrome [Tepidamorphus sp. 3E244]|uniref:c-type cytochrome n=1 Tax=Tepidamorphus sp. 3E244 TaxID=3385498 RepID=UPI0038FC752C